MMRLFLAYCLGLARAEVRVIDIADEVMARKTVYLVTRRQNGRLLVEPVINPVILRPIRSGMAMFIEADLASSCSWYQAFTEFVGAEDLISVRIVSELTGGRA